MKSKEILSKQKAELTSYLIDFAALASVLTALSTGSFDKTSSLLGVGTYAFARLSYIVNAKRGKDR